MDGPLLGGAGTRCPGRGWRAWRRGQGGRGLKAGFEQAWCVEPGIFFRKPRVSLAEILTVKFCSRGTCFPSPRPALLGRHRTRPAHGDSERAACLSCHVGLLRTRSALRRRPAWLPCAEGLGGTRRRLCRELGALSRLV